jgi:hypothetical protein
LKGAQDEKNDSAFALLLDYKARRTVPRSPQTDKNP